MPQITGQFRERCCSARACKRVIAGERTKPATREKDREKEGEGEKERRGWGKKIKNKDRWERLRKYWLARARACTFCCGLLSREQGLSSLRASILRKNRSVPLLIDFSRCYLLRFKVWRKKGRDSLQLSAEKKPKAIYFEDTDVKQDSLLYRPRRKISLSYRAFRKSHRESWPFKEFHRESLFPSARCDTHSFYRHSYRVWVIRTFESETLNHFYHKRDSRIGVKTRQRCILSRVLTLHYTHIWSLRPNGIVFSFQFGSPFFRSSFSPAPPPPTE